MRELSQSGSKCTFFGSEEIRQARGGIERVRTPRVFTLDSAHRFCLSGASNLRSMRRWMKENGTGHCLSRRRFLGSQVYLAIDAGRRIAEHRAQPAHHWVGVWLVVGLVGLAPRVLRSVPEGSGRSGWIFSFVAGVAAARGIFGLRLAGARSWSCPRARPASRPKRTD